MGYNYKDRTCSVCGKNVRIYEECVCSKCKEGVIKKNINKEKQETVNGGSSNE